MKRLKSLGWAFTATAVLGCGAGPAPEASPPAGTQRAAVTSAAPPIVGVTGPSACTALHVSGASQAALTQAVVDPALHADGKVD